MATKTHTISSIANDSSTTATGSNKDKTESNKNNNKIRYETRRRKRDSRRPFALGSNGEQLLPNNETVNWYKGGILNQLDKVGTLYDEWIEHPKIGRIRLFDNDFLEGLTMTYWWTVPVIYVPWSLLELRVGYRYFTDLEFAGNVMVWNPISQTLRLDPFLAGVIYYILGLILWTLFEYFTHRYVFHWHPPTPAWNSLHFAGHGLHHLTPADDLRLVFPPAVSMPLGFIMHSLFTKILFSTGIANAIYGGFVLGYACYESTHFLSHHCPVGNYLQARFRYHSAHHFNPSKKDALYGVTSQIWDVVFNTF